MSLPGLFVLGDSISMQYGPHLEKMLAGRWRYTRKQGPTASMADLEVPKDANGGDSSLCLMYLKGRAAEGGLDAKVLLLNCGLHDVKCDPKTGVLQVPLEQYKENLRQMISLVKRMGLTLVWVRTTPVCEAHHNRPDSGFWRKQADVDRYNAAADAIMAETNVPVIDLSGLTLSLAAMAEQCPDGRHFVAATQQAQAAYIAGWLTGRF